MATTLYRDSIASRSSSKSSDDPAAKVTAANPRQQQRIAEARPPEVHRRPNNCIFWRERNTTYYDDDEIEDANGKKISKDSGSPVDWVEEESYFFKLSAWGGQLLEYYENNFRIHLVRWILTNPEYEKQN